MALYEIDSSFLFEKSVDSTTNYILIKHTGTDKTNFPCVWKIGKNKGKSYINFRETFLPPVTGKKYFSHTFSLGKKDGGGVKLFTGVNFFENTPLKTYGDSRSININDCVLIEFSQDFKYILMHFVKNKGFECKKTFETWINGNIKTPDIKEFLK